MIARSCWHQVRITTATAVLALLTSCVAETADPEQLGAGSAAVRAVDSPRPIDMGLERTARGSRAPLPDRLRQRRAKVGIVRRFLRQALRAGDVTDKQREQIAQVHQHLKPTEQERAALRGLQQALSDGVRTGSLDVELVTDRSRDLGETRRGQRRRQEAALESLHGILNATQRRRVSLRLDVRAAAPAVPPSPANEEDPGRVGDESSPTDDGQPAPAERRAAPGGPPPGIRPAEVDGWGSLGAMLSRLGLTPEQRRALRAALPSLKLERQSPAERLKWREMRRAARAQLLADFASRSFEADDFFRGPFEQHRERRLRNELRMLEAVLTIVDRSQREKLAAMLLERRPG